MDAVDKKPEVTDKTEYKTDKTDKTEYKKVRAFIALGSNLGDRYNYLRMAINCLPGVIKVSSVYETEPIGGPDDQASFLNMVVELLTDQTPQELLQIAQNIEKLADRKRIVVNGPRTIDVDILLYDAKDIKNSLVLNEPNLIIPHPRMNQRRFVLEPLSEIAQDLVDQELLKNLLEEPDGWVIKVGLLEG